MATVRAMVRHGKGGCREGEGESDGSLGEHHGGLWAYKERGVGDCAVAGASRPQKKTELGRVGYKEGRGARETETGRDHQRADRGQGDDRTRSDVILPTSAPTPQFAGRSRLGPLHSRHASFSLAPAPSCLATSLQPCSSVLSAEEVSCRASWHITHYSQRSSRPSQNRLVSI